MERESGSEQLRRRLAGDRGHHQLLAPHEEDQHRTGVCERPAALHHELQRRRELYLPSERPRDHGGRFERSHRITQLVALSLRLLVRSARWRWRYPPNWRARSRSAHPPRRSRRPFSRSGRGCPTPRCRWTPAPRESCAWAGGREGSRMTWDGRSRHAASAVRGRGSAPRAPRVPSADPRSCDACLVDALGHEALQLASWSSTPTAA